MGSRTWNQGSAGASATARSAPSAFDIRASVLKNIDYFGYYIRRVSENLKNTKYPFTFERGPRIARLSDPGADAAGAVIARSFEAEEPLVQISCGKFALDDDMPETGEVALINGDARSMQPYELCGCQLNEITPAQADANEKDRILDLIFHAREFSYEEGDEIKHVRVLCSDRDNHTLCLAGTHPSAPALWAADEGYVIGRQKLALKALAEYPQPHNRPLQKLFESGSERNWYDNTLAYLDESDFVFLTGPSSESQMLQREAVRKALATPDFSVIQGPPGSGKTTVLLETIVQAIKNGQRVLLVASTHVAVDNILERLDSNGCMERFGIIPIRIGLGEKVSQKIEGYCLSEAAERERERLLAFYRSIPENERTDAQRRMESLLRSNTALDEIAGMIVDSANLVCGTTIGILQAPMIRRAIRDRIPGELFDLMILDEASKTTFPEFLVPAIYCKRFVISGDTNQLTPYCEERDVEQCIGGFFTSALYKNVCKSVFDLVQDLRTGESAGYRTGRIIVCADEDELEEAVSLVANQVENMDGFSERIAYTAVDHPALTPAEQMAVVSSNLILVLRDCLSSVLPILPPWFDLTGIAESQEHNERANAYHLHFRRFDADTDTWEQAVAWRLCRKFELHKTAGSQARERYEQEIEYLMPKGQVVSAGDKEIANVADILKNIEHAAFSSILELLESGFGYTDGKRRYVLADGLPRGRAWTSRHTLLKYQWRMHPEIAAFASQQFYGSQALLSDPKMRHKRKFSYPSSARMVWIDTSHAPRAYDENAYEADKIMEKLEDFLTWANEHPKPQGLKWEVSILTFYGRQKELLVRTFRSSLYAKFGFSGRYSHFTSPAVYLTVSTVDRYQGQEADVVYLSFVRNKTGIGFLDSQNRMNVALTRAKYQLYLFGSSENFGQKKDRIPEWLYRLATNTQQESMHIRYREGTA